LIPGWQVRLADRVLYELTRKHTPTSQRIANWAKQHELPVLTTDLFKHYRLALESGDAPPKKANLGEFAIQEVMNNAFLTSPSQTGVFLFEDHKIARASFLLPDNYRKVSTRALSSCSTVNDNKQFAITLR
jgi:hypothetical protein